MVSGIRDLNVSETDPLTESFHDPDVVDEVSELLEDVLLFLLEDVVVPEEPVLVLSLLPLVLSKLTDFELELVGPVVVELLLELLVRVVSLVP